ncbi:sugar phosphate isomerase/epimerase family protein [Aquipuribacter sp. MA13-6]|uniref:sugar phosphate isomerase/epimerase family protein n=1 Tax=unclassified Aquipuribacter TaxID=2635084 RepID=UPI003EEF23D9
MTPTRTPGRSVRAALATTAALALAATGALVAGPATAAPNPGRVPGTDCSDIRIPTPRVSFQLYSARAWIAEVGLEEVLATLAEVGYREVQPYAATYALPDGEFESLLKRYRLKASSGQAAYNEDTFDDYLVSAKSFGQRYTGSGGFGQPGIARNGSSTYADVLATAEQLNRFGELSVKNGTGKIFGHNHNWEFTTVVTDPETGETTTAWEAIVANTDPRYVTFELDIFWAENAGIDSAALIEQYKDRIELLHVKDAEAPYTVASQTDVGEGDIDWGPIFEAARGHVKYYIVETDQTPTDREFAEDSFQFLTCRG